MVKRIFLGVPVTETFRQELAKVLKNIPGKMVPPKNWHFTIQFLGNLTSEQISDLDKKLREVDFDLAFDIHLTHIGGFPDLHAANILWAGITLGHAELVLLNEKISRVLNVLELNYDTRPFTPHLTLSRLSKAQNLEDLAKNLSFQPISMRVERIVLYESKLDETGAEHHELFSYYLKNPPSNI